MSSCRLRMLMTGLLLTGLLPVGCGDQASLAESASARLDASVPPDDAAAAFEGCPPTTPAFALGMQATGEQNNITATLLSASNVPPLRYLNDWTLSFADRNGKALADVQLLKARPFMPVHGHDGNVQPRVQALSDPGHFRVNGMNLNMRGPWEIQLTVSSESAGQDYVVFHICVDE